MTTSRRKASTKSRKTDVEDPVKEEQPTQCQLEGGNCHWKIAAPNGPISLGTCKVCGATKEFRNSFEYSSWYGAKSARRGRGRPRKS